jgi:hypothetical protein
MSAVFEDMAVHRGEWGVTDKAKARPERCRREWRFRMEIFSRSDWSLQPGGVENVGHAKT